MGWGIQKVHLFQPDVGLHHALILLEKRIVLFNDASCELFQELADASPVEIIMGSHPLISVGEEDKGLDGLVEMLLIGERTMSCPFDRNFRNGLSNGQKDDDRTQHEVS